MSFRTPFLIALLICTLNSFPAIGREDTSFFAGGELRTGLSWHPEDLWIDVGGGVRLNAPYRLGAEFYFRPGHSSMIYDEGSRKVQYREKRYAALLYAERVFAPGRIEPFEAILGLSGGRAWELRKGFPDRTLAHWTIIPRIGIGYRIGEQFLLELGYRYAAQPASNAKQHRTALSFLYEL